MLADRSPSEGSKSIPTFRGNCTASAVVRLGETVVVGRRRMRYERPPRGKSDWLGLPGDGSPNPRMAIGQRPRHVSHRTVTTRCGRRYSSPVILSTVGGEPTSGP